MIACDTNIVVLAAVFHTREFTKQPHMARISANFLRSRTKQMLCIPDVVFGEVLLGAKTPKQERMRELYLRKLPRIDSTRESMWASVRLRRLLKRGPKSRADCLAYMTSALHQVRTFASWDKGFVGEANKFRVPAAAGSILNVQAPACVTPEELMPKTNPFKKRKVLSADRRAMKMVEEYRARAWRRVRAIVGNDEEAQLMFMCGVARAMGHKNVIPMPR